MSHRERQHSLVGGDSNSPKSRSRQGSNSNLAKNLPPLPAKVSHPAPLSKSSSLKNLHPRSLGDSSEEPDAESAPRSTKPQNKVLEAVQQHQRSSSNSSAVSSSSTITNYSSAPLSYDQQAVRVVVRVRNTNSSAPASIKQSTPDAEAVTTCLKMTGNKIDILDPKGEKENKTFHYDTVFGMETQQEDVYGVCVEPLIKKCLDGYNGCIFAYGQTASGKTHTMQGGAASRVAESLSDACTSVSPDIGIIPRVVHQLNNHVRERRGKVDEASGNCFDYVVKVSYLEIYNETLVDLLVDRDKQEDLKIRMEAGTTSGKDLYVQNLSERYMSSLPDYLKVLITGAKHRSVGETNMNAQSSRSHSILTITIDQYLVEPRKPHASGGAPMSRSESTASLAPEIVSPDEHSPEVLQKIGQGKKRSKIHLIDLAGSERADSTGATGDRLKEGAQINQSLSALGNVISALTSPSNSSKKHIPYRDSKLTYLLSDSLGGNALTLMITCCSPVSKNYNETMSTLRFAERVKKVVNKAVVNMDPNLLRIAELEAENLALRQQLANCKCGASGVTSPSCDVHSPVSPAANSPVASALSPVKQKVDQASGPGALSAQPSTDIFEVAPEHADVPKELVDSATDPMTPVASLDNLSRGTWWQRTVQKVREFAAKIEDGIEDLALIVRDDFQISPKNQKGEPEFQNEVVVQPEGNEHHNEQRQHEI
ncbi:hypothetical protein HDU79_007762 [Rhizoclosmatium sp. JEL0117]|nr:hypothetical protein HDU79_007762 [Rhizoclosmatium sp. JEL0117]